MIKTIVFLLGLIFSADALPQTTNPELNDITVEDIHRSQLVAETIAQIRQDCSLLARIEDIEPEYFAGFVEVCVIDNIALALSIEQGKEVTDELPVEEYAEAALDSEPITAFFK